MTTTRRLAAIMAADVAGFSAAMERDEEGTFALVQELRGKIIEPKIAEHTGRLVKTTGDGFLAEFASPIAAMRCALAIQAETASASLKLRIGLNLGDVIVEANGDVYGEGVNVAARLEALADPGGILISAKVHSEVEGKVEAAFDDRGEQQVKNIARPVRAYSIRMGSSAKPALFAAPIEGQPLSLPDKPSIAVLPFQNMSGDPEQEYFADGIVEDIITALSRFKSLFVIARNSSFSYKGKSPDIRQVGRELGVRYVLEGSVRKGGGRIRITGQLIEAATGTHLWADRFEGANADIFDLQDQVTSQVVGAIAPALQRAETDRSSLKRPDNLAAYDLYLRALSELNKSSPPALREAVRLCNQAIEIEPNYAVVHALAAFCYGYLYIYRALEDNEKECAEGLRLAERALALANDDAEVLARAAQTFTNLGGQLDRARELLDRALTVNPNYAVAWILSGWWGIYSGSPEVALEHCATALRLSPADARRSVMIMGLAIANLFLGNYPEALEWAKRAYFQSTTLPLVGYCILAACTAYTGDLQLAKEATAHLLKADSSTTLRTMRHYFERELRWRGAQNIDRLIEGLRLAGLPE